MLDPGNCLDVEADLLEGAHEALKLEEDVVAIVKINCLKLTLDNAGIDQMRQFVVGVHDRDRGVGLSYLRLESALRTEHRLPHVNFIAFVSALRRIRSSTQLI